MSKSKLVKNNVESVSKEIKNEAEVIHENLSADEQTLSDVKDYQLLIETGQAEKISPKASGMLTWQLAISEVDNELYLRLVANGCGGLFSKDWISLSKIATVLETQPATGFSSGVFRPLFKGKRQQCRFSGCSFTLPGYMSAGGTSREVIYSCIIPGLEGAVE